MYISESEFFIDCVGNIEDTVEGFANEVENRESCMFKLFA